MSLLRSIYLKSGLVAAALPALLLVPRTGSLQAQNFQPTPVGGTGPSVSFQMEDPAAVIADLQVVRKVAKIGIEEMDRTSFEPEALVSSLGKDRATLHGWVLANTKWLPYRGALRGARGVLQDQSGSHLDRAILLGTLLEAAGIEGQIVRGQLPEELARDLLAKAVAPAPAKDEDKDADDSEAGETSQAEQLEALLEKVRKRGVKIPAGIEAKLDSQRLQAEQLQEQQIGTTVQNAERLRTQLEWPALDRNAANAEFASSAEAVRAFQDACWFRVQDGEEVFDLSLLPDGVTPADAGIESPTLHSLTEIPEADEHRLRIRVSIERTTDLELEEAVVLDHEFATHSSEGELLSFSCQPTGVEEDAKKSDVENLRALAGATDWIPALRYGDELIVQKGFDTEGNINEAPMAFATQSAIADAARTLDQLGSAKPARGSEECTALHLDYIVTTPAGVSEHRRTLFDLVGPATRSKGTYTESPKKSQRLDCGFTMLGESKILVSSSKPSSSLVVFESLTGLDEAADAAIGFIAAMQVGARDKMEEYSSSMPAIAPLLRNLQSLRHQGSPVDAWTAVASPQVLTSHEFCKDQGDRLTRYDATDIVCNDLAVFGIDAEQARTARLFQGVADTVAERLALGGNGRSNVVAWEQQLASEAEAWSMLRTPEDVAAAKVPADDAERICQAIAKGAIVRAPVEDASDGELGYAWWRIDPNTGTCLGIGDRGWGQEMVEYTETEIAMIRAMTPWYKRYGATMICVMAQLTARMILGLVVGAAGTAVGGPVVGGALGLLVAAIIDQMALSDAIVALVKASPACRGVI